MKIFLVSVILSMNANIANADAIDGTITANIDLTAPRPAFVHNWKKCVGSGHMLLGTRADWRAHLKLARDELGIEGIRGHGLFDDDMSVVPRLGQPPEFYNVDQVLDYLVELGLKPVVELSFMPKALAKCQESDQSGGKLPACQHAFGDNGGYKGVKMPPADPQDWYALVKALAEHLVWRYGLTEVSTWKFEVWNEMWGVDFPDPYMSLYNASARALKAVDRALKVGGPATMQTLDVAEFIANASAYNIPVDFVSSHYYPTDPQCQTNETKSNIDCFADQVLTAQRYARKAGLPFLLTEYNNGLGQTSRDDSSAAAFIFRQIGRMQPLDVFSWWTFSDVFEEGWMRSAPFHNGYGMMTMQGTRKPSWRAFEALKGAGTLMVPVTGGAAPANPNSTISVFATDGGGGKLGIQAFVANWHRVDAQRYSCDRKMAQCKMDTAGTFTDEALCNANCPGADAPTRKFTHYDVDPFMRNVSIVLTHASDTSLPATVKVTRIDAEHANPLALWEAWGSPQYINKTQEAQLDDASQTKEEQVPLTQMTETQSFVTIVMPEYSALHLVM